MHAAMLLRVHRYSTLLCLEEMTLQQSSQPLALKSLPNLPQRF